MDKETLEAQLQTKVSELNQVNSNVQHLTGQLEQQRVRQQQLIGAIQTIQEWQQRLTTPNT